MPKEKIDKITLANDDIKRVLKIHGLKIEPQIDFPNYKVLPDDVLLALNVLNKHGMKINFSLANK